MDKKIIENQLDSVLNDSYALIKNYIESEEAKGRNIFAIPSFINDEIVTRVSACIERITGKDSSYYERLIEIRNAKYQLDVGNRMLRVAKALLEDVKAGYLTSLIEIIHADLYSDFIDMAVHLIINGYKDAAAVIAGSALEIHLKKISIKNNISVEEIKSDGSVKHKKANQINQDLCTAKIYSQLEQKSITAWLDLRNNAAHGKYDQYDVTQVKLYIDNIREFIKRYPA